MSISYYVHLVHGLLWSSHIKHTLSNTRFKLALVIITIYSHTLLLPLTIFVPTLYVVVYLLPGLASGGESDFPLVVH